MDDAWAELEAASRRKGRIDQLLEAELRALKRWHADHSRDGTYGVGRPSVAEGARKDRIDANIAKLRANILPGEETSRARANAADLQASARAHAEHHAQAESAPGGYKAEGNRFISNDDL